MLNAKPSVSATSVVHSREVQALLIVLSITGGCTDSIGFLGLNHLFTAHITGNFVIIAAHFAGAGQARVAPLLSVPVFMAVVCLTRMLAGSLESKGLGSLRPLLVLQFLLLAGFLILGVLAGEHIDPNATIAVVAGMLGVSAMAVHNALVQFSLKGAPPTAAMTGNVTRFALDVGAVLLGDDAAEVAKARSEAARILAVILGFAVGCGLGAACEVAVGLWSLAVPAGLALFALILPIATDSKPLP